VLTAILLAGRTDSAFTAQIGAMKMRQEIDAMRTIGLDPMEALVAPRLIASASDLDAIAAGQRDLPVLKGWRFDAFGSDAIRLCKGEIALSAKGNDVRVVSLEKAAV
jgi:hypothetical protein